MRCPRDHPFIRAAFVADVVAALCAFVAGIGKAHTVSGEDCDGKFSGTFAFWWALAAFVGVFIAQCIALSYIDCDDDDGSSSPRRIGSNETIRDIALLSTLVPLITLGFVLYKGLKYKKKMVNGDDDSSIPMTMTCVPSHPHHLYIGAALCLLHFLIFFLAMACAEEDDAAPSHGNVELT